MLMCNLSEMIGTVAEYLQLSYQVEVPLLARCCRSRASAFLLENLQLDLPLLAGSTNSFFKISSDRFAILFQPLNFSFHFRKQVTQSSL